jgi:hypothetical protein
MTSGHLVCFAWQWHLDCCMRMAWTICLLHDNDLWTSGLFCMTMTSGLWHDNGLDYWIILTFGLLHDTDLWTVARRFGLWFTTLTCRLSQTGAGHWHLDTGLWIVVWHRKLVWLHNTHMTLLSDLLQDTEVYAVAWHWNLDCCMTLTSGLLHDKTFWTVSWDWLLHGLMHDYHFGFLLHDTNFWHVAWCWPQGYCMTLTSGLFCDTGHCTFAWQWHLNSCITRISAQLHDSDRWTIEWQWHLVCCMTLTFWLLRDTASPSHDITDRWTVSRQWFLDFIITL